MPPRIARIVITAKYSDFSPSSATAGIQGAVTLQSSGTNSKSVKLTPNKHVLVYNQDGGESPDTTFTFTTAIQNMATNASNTYYEFKVNGGNPTGGAVNGLAADVLPFTLPDADEPADRADSEGPVQRGPIRAHTKFHGPLRPGG